MFLLLLFLGLCRSLFGSILLEPSSDLKKTETLIFYHIPKTAGTTVTYLLRQQFDPIEICPDYFYYDIEKRSYADLSHYRFIRGHFFFNSNLRQLPSTKKITFLRDPVKRVLSEQRIFQQFYAHNPWVLQKEHFLPPGEPIDSMQNHQCLFLSSLDRSDPNITDAMHLESAKWNLVNEFFFVGITEQIDDSIHLLFTLLGWQIPPTIPKLMMTDHNLETDASLLKTIRERNWADIELYEFAKQLLEKSLKKIR